MAIQTGTTLGRYEILDLLGVGGMGEVYRARDQRLERMVAIKTLPAKFAQNDEALSRFRRESRAIAALNHPNIRSIYDIDSDADTTFAVMELLEGQTLDEFLSTRSKMGWQSAAAIALGIAEGLAAAHAKGIIHRDIKPQNIFITQSGDAKILDFGLARIDSPENTAHDDAATISLVTQSGVLMGTVQYMSPEQARGKIADARSDIFSFGCVLHEMLSGQRIFSGDSNADVMAAILQSDPPLFTDLGITAPPDLQRIVSHCLEKNPEQRFQSARELPFAIRGMLTGSAATPTPYTQQSTETTADEPPSIAVLPFANMSSEAENEFFSDGLAEELINALSNIDGLQVASRTSSFAYKGKNQDIRDIGEQLKVRTILEGSVRKSGDRLRIRAQLVNVDDGYELWSETFNLQLEDVFAVQDEIAENIAKALRVVLTAKIRRSLGAQTSNVQAYEFYLRGRQSSYNFQRRGLERARKLFIRATELDPQYAAAFAGIADASYGLYLWFGAVEAYKIETEKASRKAIELAPQLAEAHVSRANALYLYKRTQEALAEFEEAIRLDPNLFEAHYYIARAWFSRGDFEKAAQYFERASSIRPEDYQTPSFLANCYEGLKREDKSAEVYTRAIEACEKHLELFPEDARALYLGATCLVKVDQLKRGLEWVERAIAAEPEEPIVLYNVGCVYANANEIEKAIDCLDDTVTFGIGEPAWFFHDPDLDPLRDHPRFIALLERLEKPTDNEPPLPEPKHTPAE
jgi:serine/threonine protein kinase/tetratricopeptide (TPR) repeat protein